MKESSVEELARRRQHEEKVDARQREKAEQEAARLLKGERLEMAGLTWMRAPRDPSLLINESSLGRALVVMPESMVRDLVDPQEAEQRQAAEWSFSGEVARLQAQIDQLLTSTANRKKGN